jgi:hypothetical protein
LAAVTGAGQEANMDALRQNPLLFYLLILWAVVTTILLLLFVWRAFLEGHEDDQVFIGSAEERRSTWRRNSACWYQKSTG